MFGINLKFKKILVISNDVGGAKLIQIFCEVNRIKANYYLKGPSKEFFTKKNYCNDLNKAIKHHDLIFIGTSLKANLEFNAIKLCDSFNKKYVVFLDHWVNYLERFIRKNQRIFPKNIYVFDKHALDIAKNVLKSKKTKITLKKNYYKKFFLKNKKKIKQNNKALYVSSYYESIFRSNFDYKLFKIFYNKKLFLNKKIYYKKHPAEPNKIFNKIKSKYPFLKEEKRNFIEKFYWEYDYIIGSNSMIMVYGSLLNLKVYNNIKNTGLKNTLPKKYIDKII